MQTAPSKQRCLGKILVQHSSRETEERALFPLEARERASPSSSSSKSSISSLRAGASCPVNLPDTLRETRAETRQQAAPRNFNCCDSHFQAPGDILDAPRRKSGTSDCAPPPTCQAPSRCRHPPSSDRSCTPGTLQCGRTSPAPSGGVLSCGQSMKDCRARRPLRETRSWNRLP